MSNCNCEEHKKENVLSCGCGHCNDEERLCSNEKNATFFDEYGFNIIKISLSLIFLLVGIFVKINNVFSLIIFSCSAFISGYELVIGFFKSIIKLDFFNENTLMFIATITAFILGEYFEGAMIIILFSTGELLEGVATENSRKKIVGLSKLKSKIVHLITKNGSIDEKLEEIEVGSLIEIKTGEIVPIDGVLLGLPNDFDMKAITGESKFITIENGGVIYSGAINVGNPVVIKTTKLYKDSTVENIISMVEGSLSKKAKSQKFITNFAKFYTPIIFFLAVIVATIPPLIDGFNFVKWVYKALSFLVISCPCALVISVPLSFFVGIGALAKQGVLVKGSSFLEKMARTKTVVFDKTGTLTYGDFKIENIEIFGEYSKKEVLENLVAIEQSSSHPIAKAIVEYSKIDNIHAENVKEYAGKGICGVYKNNKVCVGNAKLMKENGIKIEESFFAGTVLYLSINENLCAKIYIVDQIKLNAKNSVLSLKNVGVENIVVLSGDQKEIVKNVSEKLSIDKAFYELLPNQKAEKLKELSKQNKGTVLFVGDGINDSPSLAIADVGVAMGGLGSEVAIESSDVVVMDDNLMKLPRCIKHAKRVRKTVLQNIIGSVSIKFAVMLLSVSINLPVWVAMFSDVGVMILAVLNSLKNSKVK